MLPASGTTQRNNAVNASASPETVAIENSARSMRGLATGGSVVLVMIAILLFAHAKTRAPIQVPRLSDYFLSLCT
jgi:hypothetical protein